MTEYLQIKDKAIWLWGAGNLLKQYQHLLEPCLNIVGVCDKDTNKQGTEIVIQGKKYMIQAPKEFGPGEAVIICVLDRDTEKLIRQELDDILYCHIIEAVDGYWTSKEDTTLQENLPSMDKMVKFIDCHVPIEACNLKCSYCYLSQQGECVHRIPRFYSAKFIRKALSRKRMGGTIFINFCGVGETLLCKELLPIVAELIEEGHYVQIVTNATINSMVDKYLQSGIDLSHLFFKCSFHYLQLKERNLLQCFSENVKRMRKAGASVTVEITPEDALIPYIDEVKEFSLREFGALPHLSVARDDTGRNYDILSACSKEEYGKIWSVFESPMFKFKMEHMDCQKDRTCMAGEWAIELNLETGVYYKCVRNEVLGNLYDLTKEPIFDKVGKACPLAYCFNCHAYLTLGLIPEVSAPTYCEMRDRETVQGEHWLSDTMKQFFEQKLFENNQYKN